MAHHFRRSLLCCALACVLLLRAEAFKVVIAPSKTECISETLDRSHFDVAGNPRIEGAAFVGADSASYHPSITIRVLSPQGDQMWSKSYVTDEAHFNIHARGPGTYKVCFYNAYESHVPAVVDLVYFTLAHIRKPTGGTINVPKGTSEERGKEVAQKDHMDQVKHTVMGISELLEIVQGEQRYLHRKLERHIQTVESSNWRTRFFTAVEVLAVLGTCFLQVYYVMWQFRKAGPKLSV